MGDLATKLANHNHHSNQKRCGPSHLGCIPIPIQTADIQVRSWLSMWWQWGTRRWCSGSRCLDWSLDVEPKIGGFSPPNHPLKNRGFHFHHPFWGTTISPNSLLLGFLMQLEIWPPWCWLVWSVSWALKWSCLPLSPIVSGCLPLCGGWVLVGVAAFLGSEVVLSPVVSGCLPSCGGRGVVGVAASRTKIFRNQNHRFQCKFAYCKLFGVYAGVILETPISLS